MRLVVLVTALALTLASPGSASTAGPPPDTDYLLAAGSFTVCCGVYEHVWVNAWIDPRREWIPGRFRWSTDSLPNVRSEGGIYCLNVQGREAAVVGLDGYNPWSFKFVFRDNGRKPDELISRSGGPVWDPPDCDFVPGQPAQSIIDGDVNIHDSPSWP